MTIQNHVAYKMKFHFLSQYIYINIYILYHMNNNIWDVNNSLEIRIMRYRYHRGTWFSWGAALGMESFIDIGGNGATK